MEPPSLRSNSGSHWSILLRHYRLIVGLTLACAAGTGLFSLLQKKVYRASTSLLLSGSKIETGQTMIPNYVYYELLRSYEVFLLNDELIQATIEHFRLHSPPNSLTVDDFRKRRIIEIEWSKNTRLLEVRAEFPDPHLAAEIVNFFASSTVRFNDELYARDLEKVQAMLKEQLNQSARQLESVRQRLKQFDQSSNLELANQALQSLSELNTQNQERVLQLEVEKARAHVKKDHLLQELKEMQAKIAPRSLEADSPALSGKRGADDAGIRLQELQRQVEESTVEILETDAAIEALRKIQESNRRELISLQKEKTTKDGLQRQLLDEYQAARDNYETQDWKYQDAASGVGSRSTDLKVIARAIPPTIPYKPWIALNSVLGGAL
jgi:uncharacterized protein involved in exopolysaccharide biosynthesis